MEKLLKNTKNMKNDFYSDDSLNVESRFYYTLWNNGNGWFTSSFKLNNI